jgi:hypothetical protein
MSKIYIILHINPFVLTAKTSRESAVDSDVGKNVASTSIFEKRNTKILTTPDLVMYKHYKNILACNTSIKGIIGNKI